MSRLPGKSWLQVGIAAAIPTAAIVLGADESNAGFAAGIAFAIAAIEVLVEETRAKRRHDTIIERVAASDGPIAASTSPRSTAPSVALPFPLDDYVAPQAGEEAQCPRCGSFSVASQSSPGAAIEFRCAWCDHGWAWITGADWPDVVVQPSLRSDSVPSG